MNIFVVSGCNPNTRAGNYIHFGLAYHLALRGHKVFFLAPQGHWVNYAEVAERLNIINLVSRRDLYSQLQNTEIILWIDLPNPWAIESKLAMEYLLNTSISETKTLIYICLDYWEGWVKEGERKAITEDISQKEHALVGISKFIMAVSPQLCTYLACKYKRVVHWLPNAAHTPDFHTMRGAKENWAIVVSSTFPARGVKNIYKLAMKYKDWNFFWFGVGGSPAEKISFRAPTFPYNVHFLGEVSNTELLPYLSRAKLGIVAAGANPFSYFADPTKWYLYHAAGLPIVSLNTPHHQRFPQIYPYTACGTDWISTFEDALNYVGIEIKPLEIHSWAHRAQTLEEIVLKGESGYGYATPDGSFALTIRL